MVTGNRMNIMTMGRSMWKRDIFKPANVSSELGGKDRKFVLYWLG